MTVAAVRAIRCSGAGEILTPAKKTRHSRVFSVRCASEYQVAAVISEPNIP